ncbi:flagellar protein FliT [Ornithinibacillus halophilus]|uniref:Flagellar protein FliT n=1 Tax=Ornithinibacillus halophilus TaxID=930117 RepID=A0A1M5FC89_9BACI|nr:flagellar protein FliT [Ornithinibacillus halophilus]SHF89106.1 flagellar protein FliT [Ornithinibacillus halophilus]
MNRLKKIYDITVEIEHSLNKEIDSSDREALINHINQLIEKRGIYMEEATDPFTDEEIKLGKEVVRMNQRIQPKMDAIFLEIKKEIKQMKKKKTSNKNYVNPYQSVQTMDGMFLDKKK